MRQGDILLSEQAIAGIIETLAGKIADDFAGRQLQLLGLLKGCHPFMADLSRALSRFNVPLSMFYLHARSYVGRQSTGVVQLGSTSLLDGVLPGIPVLLLDDIFDTGETLRQVVSGLHAQDIPDVHVCVLLQKRGREDQYGLVDYCGTVVPDVFVVGYGLDYNQQYRELPYVTTLEQS